MKGQWSHISTTSSLNLPQTKVQIPMKEKKGVADGTLIFSVYYLKSLHD
jgi:hypothetical protein